MLNYIESSNYYTFLISFIRIFKNASVDDYRESVLKNGFNFLYKRYTRYLTESEDLLTYYK